MDDESVVIESLPDERATVWLGDLKARLDAYCRDRYLSRSVVVRLALEEYLRRREKGD